MLGLHEDTEILGSQYGNDPYRSVVPPIYLSVAYDYITDDNAVRDDKGRVVRYSRETNPSLRPLEKAVAALEGADDALAFSSGMGAIAVSLLALLKRGARVLTLKEMYGVTIQLLQDLVNLVGGSLVKVYPSTEEVINELTGGKYDVAVLEVMTNPTLKVVDLREIGRAAKEAGTRLIVDNTFTTPLLVRPLRLGASVVVHSSTKYLAGHNDVVGGIAAASASEVKDLYEWRGKLGTVQPPFEAYLTYRGLKTLSLRFERQSRTAMALAEFLHDCSKVATVYYPGLPDSPYHEVASRLFERPLYGGVLSFTLRGGPEAALRFVKALRVARVAPSLGGTETLVTLPAFTASSHISPEERRALGIEESLVRVSVGLEDEGDLVEDFGKALESIS
ncbi:cystathionine gamma-synthase family protein [Acidilobus sp.]|uniref:cystathionine gamma-synthase family protein n=1 Tax=Acidilobus sp. TaxID=1872109 RepID=UPI003D0091AD